MHKRGETCAVYRETDAARPHRVNYSLALLCAAIVSVAAPLQAQRGRLAILPEHPMPGAIVRLTLHVDDSTDRVVAIHGTMAGEPLHFVLTGGDYRAIGGIPVDSVAAVSARAVVTRSSGRVDTLRATAEIPPLPPPTEQLAVAPRFGRPLDAATQARVAREGARAREGGRRSHASPARRTAPLLV